MESQARIHSRTGWQENETDRLFRAVKEANASGAPLRSVFESLSADLGRKPNSIRNYYYACLRERPDAAQRTPAFTAFTPEETHQLLREVLMARGQGISVRACVMQMANGSHSRMLRYQNKYRTILKHRPEMIAQVCEELRREGLPCPAAAPSARMDQADAAFCDPDDAAAARLMAQPCVHHMLEGLKELLRRAARAEEAGEMQRTIDRMKVQSDLQRIAWEKDYNDCTACLQSVMDALRDCISPVEPDSPDAQSERHSAALSALHAAESFLAQQEQLSQ
ncbi:MAG: hypothetical protein IJZ74_03385 [Clostridia bacterium]|nr:hypothetical protein [Clostridia bacterium]